MASEEELKEAIIELYLNVKIRSTDDVSILKTINRYYL